MKALFIALTTIATTQLILILAYVLILHNSPKNRRRVYSFFTKRPRVKVGLIIFNFAACVAWFFASLPMFDEVVAQMIFHHSLGLGHTEMVNNLTFYPSYVTNRLQETFVTKWWGDFDESAASGQMYCLFSFLGAASLFGYKILKTLRLTREY